MNLRAIPTDGRKNTVVPMRGNEMVTTTESITPAQARRWLEKNKVNRGLNLDRVNEYAHDMTLGKWELTEESIALDKEENLVQGQHRLNAILVANKPIKMRVTRNAPPIWAIRDRGYNRQVGDFLTWSDNTLVDNSKRIVAWLGVVQLMKTRAPARYRVTRCREILLSYEEGVRWLSTRAPATLRAPFCAALVYVHPVFPQETQTFLEQYISGADLREGSPVLALRNRRIDSTKESKERQWSERLEISFQTLDALKRFVQKKQVRRLDKTDAPYVFFKELRERKGLT